jgi:integrase
MMNKLYGVPIVEEQCARIRESMEQLSSLAEISRQETICRVVQYLLTDKTLLERYLTGMAGLITKQRRKITYRELTTNIFHTRKSLPRFNEGFRLLLIGAVHKEKEIQKRKFLSENHLQVDIHSDLWKMYHRYGDSLRFDSLDFTLIHSPSLRYELKYYLRYVFERAGRIDEAAFVQLVTGLNVLIEVNPQIRYFTDITETDARAALLSFESAFSKKNGAPLSQHYISVVMGRLKRFAEYLMGDRRDNEIKVPQPYMNPFENVKYHNLKEYQTPTPVIPEDVIEQISKHSNELPPLFKLLYDIFVNTGMRLKEVLFLETGCIEDSRYDGICQLRFKPYKVLAARRRRGIGDYHRVMVPQSLAAAITDHIDRTTHLREAGGSTYIFSSQRSGHADSMICPRTFLKSVRGLISKYDIRDENGELWRLTTRQFRKTIAVTLIENGATTDELAYWLGHLSSETAAKYYAEVRKIRLAGLNTRFFKDRFDLIISKEQLEHYSEEERKLLYVDFRLEQRRVELGHCLEKAAGGQCANRSSIYNCVNCKNLCTGKKYLQYWSELLAQQKTVFDRLILAYRKGGIAGYEEFAEYKQEHRLLMSYENIVAAINGGALCE